jgi:hypothetical protein
MTSYNEFESMKLILVQNVLRFVDHLYMEDDIAFLPMIWPKIV